jgi:hypothetical protein
MPVQRSKSRNDTLDYLHAMLGQMRAMADAEQFDVLAYLIEMAYIEASDIIRGERPVPAHPSRNGTAA